MSTQRHHPSLLTGPAPFDGPESLGLAGVAPAFSDGMPDSLRPTSNMDPEGQAGSFKDGVSGSLEGEVRSKRFFGAIHGGGE